MLRRRLWSVVSARNPVPVDPHACVSVHRVRGVSSARWGGAASAARRTPGAERDRRPAPSEEEDLDNVDLPPLPEASRPRERQTRDVPRRTAARRTPGGAERDRRPAPSEEEDLDNMDLKPLPEAVRPKERQTRDVPKKAALLLGLSIRRHSVGYALMRFVDTAPFQFGLVDVGKADDVQQKALEISAVLRDLKSKGCQKMATELLDGVIPEPPPKGWRWFVSVDDSTLDRAPPRSSKDSGSQRAIAMLQGLGHR